MSSNILNPLYILKHSSKLTAGSFLGVGLNFVASIVVARVIGPDLLGKTGFVTLWLMYASLIRPGFLEGGLREMVDRFGRHQEEQALRFQNIAMVGEMAWGILPATVLLVVGLMLPDPVRRVGFLLAPLIYLGSTFNRALWNFHLAYQRYNVCARFNAMRSVGLPFLLVGLVFWIGPYSLFIAPVVVEWLLVGLYVFYAPLLQLKLFWDWKETKYLLKIGLPLALGTFVYWTYRLAGATSVAAWLSIRDLGYYSFISNIIKVVLQAFADFAGILTLTLWSEIGGRGSPHRLSQESTRISLFVTVAACAIANLGQAGFGPFVQLFLPKYEPSVAVFEILAFNIVVLTMTFIPSLVLTSAVVNKQWLHLSVWTGGLILNFPMNYFVIRLGWGLTAIAVNDVWIQLGVAVALYAFVQRYLFERKGDAWRLYVAIGGVLLVCLLTFLLLRVAPFAVDGEGQVAVIRALVIRVTLVLVIWTLVGAIIYHEFFRPPVFLNQVRMWFRGLLH